MKKSEKKNRTPVEPIEAQPLVVSNRTPVKPIAAPPVMASNRTPVKPIGTQAGVTNVTLAKRQIILRKDEVCNRCGAINSFRKTGGFRTFGAVATASARCRKCGLIVQIRSI
jgi:ribosomal protein L40E